MINVSAALHYRLKFYNPTTNKDNELPIKYFILSVFFLCLYPAKAFATTGIIIDEDFKKAAIGQSAYYLEDNSRKLTIDSVSIEEFSSKFTTSNLRYPDFGFTQSAYWVKFILMPDLKNTKQILIELDYPLMDSIEVYYYENSIINCIKTGYDYPFKERAINHRNFIFKIPVEANRIQPVYFRFVNKNHMNIPITLWSDTSFFQADNNKMFIWGALLGIMLIMSLYNLLLFFSLKDISFLYYVLYLIIFGFWQLTQSGLAYQYFWPDNFNNDYLHINDALIFVFIILLAKSVLYTSKNAPKVHKLLNVVLWCFILTIPVSLHFSYATNIQIQNALILTTIILFFSSGIIAIAKNYRPAIYFMVGWSLLVLAAITYILKINGLLPANTITNHALQIGSAFEVILLSLGLGDRIQILKKEREKIHREALSKQKQLADSFSRFVPRQFLTFLKKTSVQEIALGDQVMKEMTILFSDIRDFTLMSEKLTPQENINLLNSYLMTVGPIIRKHNGFIDKYIGDAIMALFPDSVDDAISAALDIVQKVEDINEHQKQYGINPIDIGIGIHTGSLMLGTIGEENRIETTVISDAVNIASRLEELTKSYKTKIIISKLSFEKAEKTNYSYKILGNTNIKGKQQQIEIVEILPNA